MVVQISSSLAALREAHGTGTLRNGGVASGA